MPVSNASGYSRSSSGEPICAPSTGAKTTNIRAAIRDESTRPEHRTRLTNPANGTNIPQSNLWSPIIGRPAVILTDKALPYSGRDSFTTSDNTYYVQWG